MIFPALDALNFATAFVCLGVALMPVGGSFLARLFVLLAGAVNVFMGLR